MKPKQKAKDILEKIKNSNNNSNLENDKKIALLIVDEILSIFDGLNDPEYCAFDCIGERKYTYKGEYSEYMTGLDMKDYYNKVKKEINKI